MIDPVIKKSGPKKLVGLRMKTSLSDDRTFELWRNFMPRRKEINHTAGSELYAVQAYHPGQDFSRFDAQTVYEKWAAVEVSNTDGRPDGMEILMIDEGLWATFIHKGKPDGFAKSFQYIFETWLPAAGYILDSRPHIQVMGEKYKNNDDDSEEEVWLPLKLRE